MMDYSDIIDELEICQGNYTLADKETFRHARETIINLVKETNYKQFVIDSLMLEYCPTEMSVAQIENWKKHQKPA